MFRTAILCLGILLFTPAVFSIDVRAQGGWDVWTIYLRDGSTSTAAPLWSFDNKSLKGGFTSGGTPDSTGIERSRISYISNNLGNSVYARKMQASFVKPELPKGNSTRDLVVFDDGRQVAGNVTIRPGKKASGEPDIYNPVLVQNGKEFPLTSVAHIRFAASKSPPARSKDKH